jgi:hypothetical protein
MHTRHSAKSGPALRQPTCSAQSQSEWPRHADSAHAADVVTAAGRTDLAEAIVRGNACSCKRRASPQEGLGTRAATPRIGHDVDVPGPARRDPFRESSSHVTTSLGRGCPVDVAIVRAGRRGRPLRGEGIAGARRRGVVVRRRCARPHVELLDDVSDRPSTDPGYALRPRSGLTVGVGFKSGRPNFGKGETGGITRGAMPTKCREFVAERFRRARPEAVPPNAQPYLVRSRSPRCSAAGPPHRLRASAAS